MKKEIVNYFFLLIGSFILSLGVVGFLSPNQIATGGTAGLAIILNSIFDLPIGILFFLINIPLLAIGLKYIGRQFAVKTVIAIALMTASIDLLKEIIEIKALSSDPLLATLYGGVLVGIGLGFIFKGGGSAGGGTIIAKIVATKSDLKPGSVILILDSLVILSSAIVFNSLELALWSLISIFATSKLVDLVITGRSNEKLVHISSFKELTTLGTLIHEQLGVRGTIVNGNDLSGKEKKDVIYIVIDSNRINMIKQLVISYDENARMIITETKEILGKN
jgi:uncharacterized membrane-anchored protein YitT (DUF2179 family)